MTPITSPHNPKLKQLRKLARSRERAATGLFFAEGEDLVAAAAAAGREPVYGFYAEGAAIGVEPGLPAGFEPLAGDLLAGVSSLGSGTRVVGVYEQRIENAQKGPLCRVGDGARGGLCVYLHGVRDPGNVGTVLRSAHAFGASTVALGPGCADPHSPKAVRASMGAIFSVALARVQHVEQLPGTRVALLAGAGESLATVAAGLPAPAGPLTLLVGAEREGLPEQILGACERVARIPIAGDSLNAAMAATVALYEMTRAGRPRHPPGRVTSS